MTILFICLAYFDEEIILIFNGVCKDYSAIDIVLIFLPILLIIKIMITMGQHVTSEARKKQ